MDVIWQPININRKRTGKAFLRCYKNGSIRISSAACAMISDFDNYNYAKFCTSSDDGTVTKVGIKFVKIMVQTRCECIKTTAELHSIAKRLQNICLIESMK